MKLYLDELLTDMDIAKISIANNNPLSLERIIQKTVSRCSDFTSVTTHHRRRLPLSLVAAILVGLLAITALAAATSGYVLHSVEIEYQISDDGEILPPEHPELGISLSVSNISPRGLTLSCSLDTTNSVEIVTTDSLYYLEMQTDSGWEVIPDLYENDLQGATQNLCEDQYTWYIDWDATHSELSPGTYRIQKGFQISTSEGSFETYFISEEFVIRG